MSQSKHIFICFILVFFAINVTSQNDYVLPPARDYSTNPAKTAGFVEIGGSAGLYSLNMDRIYWYSEKVKTSIRIGFSPQPHDYAFEQVYVLEHNVILFKNPHHLELGLGATLQRRYNEKPNLPNQYFWENIWFSVWRCGYRYQKQDDGLFLRAAITPVIMSHDALGFHPNYFQFWGGVGIGMSF